MQSKTQFLKKMLALIQTIAGNRLSSSEQLSIAMAALSKAAEAYDSTRGVSYSSFAMMCAKYACFARLREEAQQRFSIEAVGTLEDHRTPEDQFLRKERRYLIREAVLQLPPFLRLVVILRVFHDRKFSEIAQDIGVSCTTAWRAYHLALQVLREYFSS